MNNKALFLILSLLPNLVFSQHKGDNHNEPHTKEKGIYEIITSGIYSYAPKSNQGNFGVEIHFTYWFNHKWGSGISYTLLFGDHSIVNELALLGSWNPTKWMTWNVGPNFALHAGDRHLEIGAYGEVEFNIRPVKWFHLGPVFGTTMGHRLHLNGGFHFGFEF